MTSSTPEFDELLQEWGFDPKKYAIVNDTLRVSTWDMNVGKGEIHQAWAYKAQIVATEATIDQEDSRTIFVKRVAC